MCWKNKSFAAFWRSFGYAVRGVSECVKERNFRFHLVAAVYVPHLARYFIHTPTMWAVLFITIGTVIAAEMVNTAVERLTDLVCPDRHPVAGAVKDITAGAVLIAAFAALCVAVYVFGNTDGWIALYHSWRNEWWRPLLCVGGAVPSIGFIFFYSRQQRRNKQ